MKYGAAVLMALLFTGWKSLAGIDTNRKLEKKDENQWECAFSTSTYLVLNGRDYTSPTFVADRDWLHIVARYNYEALKTDRSGLAAILVSATSWSSKLLPCWVEYSAIAAASHRVILYLLAINGLSSLPRVNTLSTQQGATATSSIHGLS